MHENSPPGAMTIAEFCWLNSCGRTKFYQELNAGRITAKKLGTKTLIERSVAESWLRSLPAIETPTAASKRHNSNQHTEKVAPSIC
jgi:excisionase family DNA binding protein